MILTHPLDTIRKIQLYRGCTMKDAIVDVENSSRDLYSGIYMNIGRFAAAMIPSLVFAASVGKA